MKRLEPGWRAALLFSWAALCASTAAWAAPPEREVKGNRVISHAEPIATITVPRSAVYVGADRWDLYDICDAELHLFVEAGANKVVKALYWIQFEKYLPNNNHVYDYTADQPVEFAGRSFWMRSRFGPTNDVPRAGSDGEHVRQLLARAGYTLPPNMMNVRLVQVLDEARRQELMFIYSEDLASQGYNTNQLMEGDRPRPVWEELRKGLEERAMQRIRLSR